METLITYHMHIAKRSLQKYSNTVCEMYMHESTQNFTFVSNVASVA